MKVWCVFGESIEAIYSAYLTDVSRPRFVIKNGSGDITKTIEKEIINRFNEFTLYRSSNRMNSIASAKPEKEKRSQSRGMVRIGSITSRKSRQDTARIPRKMAVLSRNIRPAVLTGIRTSRSKTD